VDNSETYQLMKSVLEKRITKLQKEYDFAIEHKFEHLMVEAWGRLQEAKLILTTLNTLDVTEVTED